VDEAELNAQAGFDRQPSMDLVVCTKRGRRGVLAATVVQRVREVAHECDARIDARGRWSGLRLRRHAWGPDEPRSDQQ
jgi:hypothetical protein